VRLRAPRFKVAVYELVVAGGGIIEVRRDGELVRPEDATRYDYSMRGIFSLLRDDLRLAAVPAVGDTPAVDLRARFDSETGRLVRYRRTVGAGRRRVLLLEVLEYAPVPPMTGRARVDEVEPECRRF
jgi:hypothetical protein